VTRRYFVTRNQRERAVDVEGSGPERFLVRIEGASEPLAVTLLGRGETTTVLAGDRVFALHRAANSEFVVEQTRAKLSVSAHSTKGVKQGAGETEGDSRVLSPMPGRVLKVLVAEGASVAAGAAVVVIEAMKMENELAATRSGVVKRVRVQTGDTVERDALLLEIE
jgi:glutaconyl-CoA/methylmalonyl-CoA decarboxylase subunit gamma